LISGGKKNLGKGETLEEKKENWKIPGESNKRKEGIEKNPTTESRGEGGRVEYLTNCCLSKKRLKRRL